MTHDQHRLRHIILHEALNELFADYITHHPEQTHFTRMPLLQLLTWSKEQAESPTEEKKTRDKPQNRIKKEKLKK